MSTNVPGSSILAAAAGAALGMSPAGNPTVEGELMDADGAPITPGNPLPEEFRTRRGQRRLENITVEAIEKFLDTLSQTGLIYKSAEACGLSYITVNRLRKEDSEFKAMVEESMEQYRDLLQAECHRRAVEGWDEPVFSQRLGTMMGTVRKFDPRLLELMLKRHIPEYREKFEGEIKVSGGVLVAPIAPLTMDAFTKQFGGEQLKLEAENQALLPPPDSAT